MDYDQQPVYEAPRPAPPVLWIGLTGFFALCCCFFFGIAGAEALLLTGTIGASGSTPGTAGSAPTFDAVKISVTQPASGMPTGLSLTTVPSGTKVIYVYFTYKNMPKSGATWGYAWQLNQNDLPDASKTGQKWTKEGSGVTFFALRQDTGLAPGDYDLSLQLNDQEVQTASIHVGP